MGLLNRYRAIKRGNALTRKGTRVGGPIELDGFDLDAGDALEAEIAAELAEQKQLGQPKG